METQYQIQTLIRSKEKVEVAEVVRDIDVFRCIAKYQGRFYRTTFQPFSASFYLDDVYGEVAASEIAQ